MAKKAVLGLYERVTLHGKKKKVRLMARVDTGATRSSIDLALAKELGLGTIVKHVMVKQAYGRQRRPVIRATIKISGRELREEFTLADRSHMKYRALIGQNILKRGFLIDPSQ